MIRRTAVGCSQALLDVSAVAAVGLLLLIVPRRAAANGGPVDYVADAGYAGSDLAFSTDWIANHRRAPYIRVAPDYGSLGEAVFPEGKLDGPPGCLRFEVTRVDPRANGRFCLGELMPRVHCRDERLKRPTLEQAWRHREAR